MKEKLAVFSTFANSLYPNEVEYLSKVQKFKDPENIQILNVIRYNVKHVSKKSLFDTNIDKRKYSKLKKWIYNQLNLIDVDYFFNWLSEIDKKINTDNILADDEKLILKELKIIKPTSYYFIRFYELLENYNDYLLIRMRFHMLEQVNRVLEKYRANYEKAIKLQKTLHELSEKLIHHDSPKRITGENYARQFENIIENEHIDGFTRYRAFIRLSYYHYRISNFNEMKKVYVYLDKQFEKNLFYSKRILANYYANRALMHVKLNEFDNAEYYGRLSIQQKNTDFVFYLINFSNILLKKEKYALALDYQKKAIQEVQKTNDFYLKVGFASIYIKTLIKNKFYKKAAGYGKSFLDVYHKEIFDFRWHLFFNAYIEALFYAESFDTVILLCKRYKLHEKEKKLSASENQAPKLFWYFTLSKYMSNSLSEKGCVEILKKSVKGTKFSLKGGRLAVILKTTSYSMHQQIILE